MPVDTFRVRILKPFVGFTGRGLQTGDSIFFKLTSVGTLETYGFVRKGMPLYFTDDDGKRDDKNLSLWLIDPSFAGSKLEMAMLELVQLIGAVCNLPNLKKSQNGNCILWEFHRDPPGS
jgi:hypothetical protein